MREDKIYAQCFSQKPHGHAVYRDESPRDLRPGACGYFDYDGKWVTIVQNLAFDFPRLVTSSRAPKSTLPKDTRRYSSRELAMLRLQELVGKDFYCITGLYFSKSSTFRQETLAINEIKPDTAQPHPPAPLGSDPAEAAEQTEDADLLEVINEAENGDAMATVNSNNATELMKVVEQAQSSAVDRPKDAVVTTETNFSELGEVSLNSQLDQEAWGVVEGGSICLADYEVMANTT